MNEQELQELYAQFSEALTQIMHKAYLYDIEKIKRSQGGKKSSRNMTAKQRSERARNAAKARFKKGK